MDATISFAVTRLCYVAEKGCNCAHKEEMVGEFCPLPVTPGYITFPQCSLNVCVPVVFIHGVASHKCEAALVTCFH